MKETPNTVHGRLLEAVHISGYSFERACAELEWLLDEDRWKSVAGGFTDINAFLATIDLSEFRIAVKQRKKLARRLKAIEASQRATGRLLGVDHVTIGKDLRGEKSPPTTANAAVSAPAEPTTGEKSPPAGFQLPVAEVAKATQAKVKKEEKRQRAAQANATSRTNVSALPAGKYAVIYADPPWSFEVWSGEGKDRAAENHYPTMTQAAIEALPVADLAADDCALFLWAVMPQLPEALRVIEAWGFTFKTCAFVWVKQTKDGDRFATGMGYWTRANAELCLLATRGSPKRLNADVHQVVLAPRMEHSAKPDEIATRIERLIGGPYLELFRRGEPRAGWSAWGNQLLQPSEAA